MPCANRAIEPAITPIQAELIADLHARLLKAGATVYAKVTADWTGADCVLRSGAILEAHVVLVAPYTPAAKVSQVDLAFTRAQCGNPRMGDFELMLAALAAPPRNSDLGILSDPLPFNTAASGPISGIAGLAAAQMSANYNVKLNVDSAVYEYAALPRMHMGDVSGIRGLKLGVGSGAENSSVLTAKGHDVALEKHTVLLLVPAQGTFPHGEASSGAPPPASAPSASVPPAGERTTVAEPVSETPSPSLADDIDLCDPAQCNVALPAGDEAGESKPSATISIRELGYAPRPQKAMEDFDHDEALAWLGPEELLVAFNPHELMTRLPLGPSGSMQRVIRAALLDTGTRQVIRTVDWELPDNREYLWPLAENRVLVHVASELRVYGSGLKIWRRVPLDGPLAFVRVTPDGSFIAMGVTRERHSPQLHAELKQSLQTDPEEDVDVMVLNRDFETIARTNAREGLMPPTLLNEGQARLLAQPNMRYRLAMETWDSQPSTLARFNSSCIPELSSFAPDLIFLVSCNQHNGLREYRVLQANGKLTLKGSSDPNEYGQAAKGSGIAGTFVVTALRSDVPLVPGDPFSADKFSSEALSVYRAADGKRLLGVRVASPSLSRDCYALAPDSSQLAVLSRDQISIYSVIRK
jgi:hypothetical protein